MGYHEIVKNLERKVDKLAYIHQVSHTINSMQSVNSLLEYALFEALAALESESGSIFIWNSEKNELELIVSKGSRPCELKGVKRKLGEGIAGIVAESGEPLLVKDIQNDPRFKDKNKENSGYKTSSFLCVPFFAKKKLMGVINITEKISLLPFTDDELEFLFIIANHVAIALDNIFLYKKVNNFNLE